MAGKHVLTLSCELGSSGGGVGDLCGRLETWYGDVGCRTSSVVVGAHPWIGSIPPGDEPDLVVLHYVPHRLGARGRHPEFTDQIREFRSRSGARWMLVVHETRARGTGPLRTAVLDWRFRGSLGGILPLFDRVFGADSGICRDLDRLDPGGRHDVFPVGSPLPVLAGEPQPGDGHVGLFGSMHPSRDWSPAIGAVVRLRESRPEVRLRLVGRVRRGTSPETARLIEDLERRLPGGWEETGDLDQRALCDAIDRTSVFLVAEGDPPTARLTSLACLLSRKRPVILYGCDGVGPEFEGVLRPVAGSGLADRLSGVLENWSFSPAQVEYADRVLTPAAVQKAWQGLHEELP